MAEALQLQVVPALQDPILLLAFEGWNDAGDSASSAVRFVDEALRTSPLARIDPEEYYDFTVSRPELRLHGEDERRIHWPSYDFRFGSLPGRCELVTGLGGEPHLRWRSFCDQVLALVHRFGIQRVVLLGAYLADVLYSLPVQVTGFATREERMRELGIQPSRYEGPTGIIGVLAERLGREQVEVSSFWAGLPHYITVTPNPRGTLALVQVLGRVLDLPLDQAPLHAAAAEFEGQVAKLVAEDPALAEYVRQLKRRGFAQ